MHQHAASSNTVDVEHAVSSAHPTHACPAAAACFQGTLREALDRRLLPVLPGSSMPHPSVVNSLAHDIAAAMLHLHHEGIV
jgi:hypothetical protein